MTEEWKPVPGFDGYDASDLGRLRSHKRRSAHLMTPTDNGFGYLRVSVQVNGKTASLGVHRAVMLAFVGPRPPGMEIRHHDGDSTNNALVNLSYSDHTENMRDRVRHGTDPNKFKLRCPADHLYNDTNTYITPLGKRMCRACNRAAQQRYLARRDLVSLMTGTRP